MGAKEPKNFVAEETQTKLTTIKNHKKEFDLIIKIINHHISGFGIIDKFIISDDNKLQYAWLLLTTRSFNSLRCAFDLLLKGYYSQAMMLIRTVDEDWLICRDCETNEDTLKALLTKAGNLRKGDLRYSEMAKRISDNFYDSVWKGNYGQESEIAHASQTALRILVEPDSNTLMLGSHYNKTLFIVTYQAFLRIAVGMMEFLAKLLGNKASQWCMETLSTIQAANAEIKRISDEVKSSPSETV